MGRLQKCLFVCGCLGIADTGFVLTISGINIGTLLPGVTGILLIALALLQRKRPIDFSFLRRWNAKTAIFLLFSAWLISFGGIESLIFKNALSGAPSEASWCIILGAGLRGEQPSLTLRRRLEAASAYLAQHPDTRVIASGGKGPAETISEAEAMRRFLVNDGIDPKRIFLEDRATSTFENLTYAKAILEQAGVPSETPVCVITNEFHIWRVRLLANRLKIKIQVIGAPTPWYLLPNVCIREYFAILKSLLVDE